MARLIKCGNCFKRELKLLDKPIKKSLKVDLVCHNCGIIWRVSLDSQIE